MIQNTFHNQNNDTIKPPPNQFNLTLIQRLASIYKLWHEFLLHFPKDTKYTLGNKIDSLVLEVLEFTIKASNSDKATKLIALTNASVKLDLLKFFLRLAWEIKSLPDKKYILLSEKLDEVGKMLGGWIKSLK